MSPLFYALFAPLQIKKAVEWNFVFISFSIYVMLQMPDLQDHALVLKLVVLQNIGLNTWTIIDQTC